MGNSTDSQSKRSLIVGIIAASAIALACIVAMIFIGNESPAIRIEAAGRWFGWIAWVASLVLLGRWVTRSWLAPEIGREAGAVTAAFSFAGAACLWWIAVSDLRGSVAAQLAGATLAAYCVGALLGFIFSSFDGEEASIGRVREILLASLATATVVGLTTQGPSVLAALFAFQPEKVASATYLASVVIGFAAGFFHLYYVRQTVWNTEIARGRRRTRLVDQGLVLGIRLSDIDHDEVDPAPKTLPEHLKAQIDEILRRDLSEVFLSVESIKARAKAEYVQGNPDAAIAVLSEGLVRYCNHGELLLYAVLINNNADRGSPAYAVRLRQSVGWLRKLQSLPRAPLLAWKLLGYCLLWEVTELQESIRQSKAYLTIRPDDAGACFNLACAYAQLGDREQMLFYLMRAIGLRGTLRWTLKKLLNQDFKQFASDPDVLRLLPRESSTPPPNNADAGERENLSRDDRQDADDEQGNADE